SGYRAPQRALAGPRRLPRASRAGRPPQLTLLLDHLDEQLDEQRIELAARHRPELRERDVVWEGVAIGAVGPHRVPGVTAGDDPRLDSNRLTGQTIGIA